MCVIFLSCCALIALSSYSQPLSRNVASHLLDDIWMRDPYIYLHKDTYYLTYTNGEAELPVWTSKDLRNWKNEGDLYKLSDLPFYQQLAEASTTKNENLKLWAPEIYHINDQWVITHTTNVRNSALVVSKDLAAKSEDRIAFSDFGHHHDPSIFTDTDGRHWLVDKCAVITEIDNDFSAFKGKPIKLNPKDRKMGHEGCQIIKVEDKYVWFGTAWSTDSLRNGTYNLYYATSDKLEGPYSERKFAGYCLGHGTVFQDKDKQWWCTAFQNGTSKLTQKNKAYTINKQGLTLVPLSIKAEGNSVVVLPLDTRYVKPN